MTDTDIYSRRSRISRKIQKKDIDILIPFLKFLFTFILVYLFLKILNSPWSPIISSTGDNAKYLISALLQSLAAILALGATITIVVMQMSSQHYTPRVVDSFVKKRFYI